MNETIRNELILLLNIDSVKPDEQIKILSICSAFLSSKPYNDELKKLLNPIFNQPDGFDIGSEFARLIINILNLNQQCTYYKVVGNEKLKYIIYGIIYNFLLREQLDFLNGQNLGTIRLLYCNAWDLLSFDINKLKIIKETCIACCGLFGSSNKIII